MNFISHRFIYLEGASHSRRRGRRLMDGQGGGGGTELHHMISKEKSDIMNATENGVKAVLGEADRKSAKGPKKIKGVRNELEERLIKAGVFAEQALDEKHHDAHAALYHHTYRDSVEDVKDAPYHVITQMQKGLAVAEKELTKSLNSKLKLSESNRETKRLDQRKESISTVISEKKELYKAGETIAKERLNTLERNASSYLLLPNGKVQGQEQLDQIYEIILRDADAFLKGKSIRLDIPDMKVKKINKKLLKEIFGEDMTRTQIMDFLLWNQGSKKPSAENRIIGSNKDNPKVENQYKREVGSIKKRRDIFDTHLNQEGTKGSASRLFNLFRNGTIAAGTSTVTAKKSEIIQGVKEINWGKEEIFPKEIQDTENLTDGEAFLYILQFLAGKNDRTAKKRCEKLTPTILSQLNGWFNYNDEHSGRNLNHMRQRQNHYTDLKKTMDTANDLYQHYHPKDFQKLGIAAAAGDRASERMLQEHVGYARIIVDNYETLGPGSQGDVNGSLMQSIESGIFTDQKEISEIQQAWAKIEELYRDIAGPKLKNWEDNVQTDPDTLIAPTKLRYSHPLVRAVWRGVEYISPEWLHQKVFEDERKFAKKGIAKNSHENEEAKSFNQRMMDSIVNDTEIEAESDGGTARKEPGVLSQLRDDYNKKHEEQWPDTQAILENQKPGKSISLQYQDITHRDNFNILAPSSELKNLQVIDNQNGILLKGKRDKTDVLVYISDKNVGIDKRIAGDSENPDQNPPKTELQNTSGKMAIIDRDKVQETDPNTLNIQNYISKAKLGICMNPVPSDLYRKDSLLRETWKQNKQT